MEHISPIKAHRAQLSLDISHRRTIIAEDRVQHLLLCDGAEQFRYRQAVQHPADIFPAEGDASQGLHQRLYAANRQEIAILRLQLHLLSQVFRLTS